MHRTRRGRADRPDDGFTIVEVVIAMVIIVGVMATMLGVLISGLGTIAQARQRQTATALATQALERMRALPYDTVTLHDPTATPTASASFAALDGSVWELKLDLAGNDIPGLTGEEELVVNGVSAVTRDEAVDSVTYRVHTYVTEAPLTPGGQHAFHITAVVVYSSSVSNGRQIIAQRSLAYSPTGCLSTAQNPFAAPCQAYFTANAGQTLGGITVSNPNDSTQPIAGFDAAGGRLLELGLPDNSTTLLVEQTASAEARVLTSGARSVGTTEAESGSLAANAPVDSDPSSVQGQTAAATVGGYSAAAQSVQGPAGSLVAAPAAPDAGTAASAIFAGTSHCIGTNGTPLITGPTATTLRPCAWSSVQPAAGTARLTYEPSSPGGFNSLTIPMVTIGSTSPARAVAAQLAHPNAAACTTPPGPTGVGCGHAAATRRLGTTQFGFAPSAATLPPGFDPSIGFVRVTSLSEEVRTEEGSGARAPYYLRDGDLRIYTGDPASPYTYVNLESYDVAGNASGQWLIPESDVVHQVSSGKQLTLRYDGTVTVSNPQQVRTPTTRTGDPDADCKTDACISGLNGGSFVTVSLEVVVIENGTEIARFGIAANLGGLAAEATFKAAADAP